MTPAYYPLFADLTNRRCVVIGAGMIAQRKVATLLDYGAQVTVISPDATPRFLAHAKQGKIRYAKRQFRPSDLRGAWLVFAATDDQRLNARVFRAANRLRIFTNVVDQKPLCSFIAPAIVKQGDLVIAISTGGASPAVAKHLRKELASRVGQDYARMIRLLGSLRGRAKRRLPDFQARKRYFDSLVDGHVFQLVRTGRMAVAKREALAVLAKCQNRCQTPSRCLTPLSRNGS